MDDAFFVFPGDGAILKRLFTRFTLLLLTGCLDYTERIIIGRDGSATIRLRLRVAAALKTLISTNKAFQSLAIMTDPAALKTSLPEGLSLRSHQIIPSSGRQVYLNELYAADARQIKTGDSPVFKGQQFSIETLPDGSMRYHRKLNFTDALRDPELSSMIAQNKFGILGILKGAPFAFELATPLKVLSTNGTLEGDVVSWHYMLYDLLQAEVEQEVIMAPPTQLDLVIGAATMLFRPQTFPFVALFLLGIFFITTQAPKKPLA